MTRYIVVLVFCFNILAAAPCSSAEQEEKGPDKPLPYPSEATSIEDSLLILATAREPLILRGKQVEAPLKVTDYFLARPWLAYRLAEELKGSPLSFLLDKEGDEWDMSAVGKSYNLKPLSDGKKIKVFKFIFLFRFPFGIGIKSTGGGFVVIQTRPDDDNDGALIDYDIYLVTGSTPIDKLTKQLPFIQNALAQADLESVLNSFIELCEAVADDPESVAEEMEEADEIFNKIEIEEFKSLFVKKQTAS